MSNPVGDLSGMRETLRTVLLIVPAVIHLLPVPGVLGRSRLTALYGLPFDDPNLLILMQHRAVLFGLLGVFLLIAAFRPELQVMAIAAGLISAVSFIVIALAGGGYNEAIQRVLVADVVAIICLGAAGITLLFPGPSGT